MSIVIALSTQQQAPPEPGGRELFIADRLDDVLNPRPFRKAGQFVLAIAVVLTKCLLVLACVIAATVFVTALVYVTGPVVIDRLYLLGRYLNSAANLTESIVRASMGS